MFDFTKKSTYTDGGGNVWEYYGDDSDSTVFYIVPVFQFITVNNLPVCEVVEYKTGDANNGSGYCHMDVELAVPDTVTQAVTADILQAFQVKARIKPFPFKPGGTAYITYTKTAGSGRKVNEIVTAPLVKMNRTMSASFLVELDAAGIKTFNSALGDKGSAGLSISYSGKVRTVLPSLTCTVAFNAAKAFAEQIGDEIKGAFPAGGVTISDIMDEIIEDSPAGGACTVTVTPGTPAPPQAVTDQVEQWGKRILKERIAAEILEVEEQYKQLNSLYLDKKQIEQVGQRLLKQYDLPKDTFSQSEAWMQETLGDNYQVPLQKLTAPGGGNYRQFLSEIESVGSFRVVYPAKRKVPWIINAGNTLSVVNAGYSRGSCCKTTDKPPFILHVVAALDFREVSHIDAWVNYAGLPDDERNYTFTSASVFHFFTCPMDPTAGDTCKFSYMVNYTDTDKPPLLVVWPDVYSDTSIIMKPFDSATIQTTFNAEIVDFETEVDYISISFFYQNTSGDAPPVVRDFKLTGETPEITIQSLTERPISNPYVYTVTYYLKNGDRYAAPSQTSNASAIYLLGPVQPYEQGFLLTGQSSADISRVDLDVYYINAQGKKVPQTITLTPGQCIASMDVYSADGVTLPIHYQGTIKYTDSRPDITIAPTTIPSTIVIIDPGYRYVGVELDPSSITWQNGLVQLQVNMSAQNSTGKTVLTQSFLFTEFEKSVRYWGYYMDRSLTPSYTWTGIYSFNGWPSLNLPVIPDGSETPLPLPDTPAADEMFALINKAFPSPNTLDAQGMADALSASPYLPFQVSPIIKTNYSVDNLAAILSKAFYLSVATRNNTAAQAVALKAAGYDLDTAASIIKTVYGTNWTDDMSSVVSDVFNGAQWDFTKNLAAERVPAVTAAPQLKKKYSLLPPDMLILVAAVYDLVSASASGTAIAKAMKKAGYSLNETSAAMNKQCSPAWTPEDYGQVLDVYNWY